MSETANLQNAPGKAEKNPSDTASLRALRRVVERSYSPEYLTLLTIALDFVMITIAGVSGFALSEYSQPDLVGLIFIISVLGSLWCVTCLAFSGTYRFNIMRSPLRHLPRILGPYIGSASFGLILGGYVFNPEIFKAEWAIIALFMGAALIPIGRLCTLYFLLITAKRGALARRIAVLGAGSQGAQLMRHIERDHLNVNHVVGVFDDRLRQPERLSDGITVQGTSQDLLKAVRSGHIDDVIVALPWSAEQRLRDLISELQRYAVNIRLSADLAAFQFPGRMTTDVLTGLPMITLANNPLSGWRRIVKGLEDRILGTAIVLLFLPVMLVVAAAIKLDSPGPVLFKQKRLGFNNRSFNLYKFRSMTHVDEDQKGRTQQATRGDKRITRVGAFIRKTSLDELPQLFNVLTGSMSLVGPRPHAMDHNEEFGRLIDNYFSRHKVKPGITGLAQVNGLRGETDTVEKIEYRVRYDLHYVENWSILMDLEILALSAFIGFMGRNAY